jgi:hypothetical protein
MFVLQVIIQIVGSCESQYAIWTWPSSYVVLIEQAGVQPSLPVMATKMAFEIFLPFEALITEDAFLWERLASLVPPTLPRC